MGTKPLIWDHDLAKHAYDYSKNLVDNSPHCMLKHSHIPSEGENLAQKQSRKKFEKWQELTLKEAVKMWTDEKYKWNRGSLNHFTQVIWSSTEKVGCARADGYTASGGYCQVVTCRYYPRGNIIGRSPY